MDIVNGMPPDDLLEDTDEMLELTAISLSKLNINEDVETVIIGNVDIDKTDSTSQTTNDSGSPRVAAVPLSYKEEMKIATTHTREPNAEARYNGRGRKSQNTMLSDYMGNAQEGSRKRHSRGKKSKGRTPSRNEETTGNRPGKKLESDENLGNNLSSPGLLETSGPNRRVTSRGREKAKRVVISKDKLPPLLAKFNPIVETNPKYVPDIDLLWEMESQFMHKLTNNRANASAIYFCRLCKYQCGSVQQCRLHICDGRHQKFSKIRELDMTLDFMPECSEAHIVYLSNLIEETFIQYGLNEEDKQKRKEVVDRLSSEVETRMPGCSVRMYGSSLSGFGLKDSNINIDLIVSQSQSPSKMLSNLCDALIDIKDCRDVTKDFTAKIPVINFVDVVTGIPCNLSVNGQNAYQTSKLLEDYAGLDKRVLCLGSAIRFIAKVFEIDNQVLGTLPAYVYGLMTVFFLQQLKNPVLPVLHELVDSDDVYEYLKPEELHKHWTCKNTDSVGLLFVNFLRFYCENVFNSSNVVSVRQKKVLTLKDKLWGSRLGIEDPFMPKLNLTRTICSSSLVDYVVLVFKLACKYFLIPRTKTKAAFENIRHPSDMMRPKSSMKVTETEVVNTGTRPLEKNVQNDVTKSVNGTKGLPPTAVYVSDLEEQFKALSFEESKKGAQEQICENESENTPDVSESADKGEVTHEKKQDDVEEDDLLSNTMEEDADDFIDLDDNHSGHEEDMVTKSDGDDEEAIVGDGQGDEPIAYCLTPYEVEEGEISYAQYADFITPEEAMECVKAFDQESFYFSFENDTFNTKQKPPPVCGACHKEGHFKFNCPMEELPPLPPLQPLPPIFLQALSAVFSDIHVNLCPGVQDINIRQQILLSLRESIIPLYPDAQLELFGSSCNGFGFRGSDLDVCLTFQGNATGENLEQIKIIKLIAKRLNSYRDFSKVISITTAKVPIVKSTHNYSHLDVDISLYNTLAQHNTTLLRSYAKIDHRVEVLGYILKYFAKVCDMGDASRGSLSSYAYILLLLHFLQQRSPPVIPILQDLYDKSKKQPEVTVDEWNAWFFKDLERLPEVWPAYGKNKETIGELWIGLLCFYTEVFNFKEHVVNIRQMEPLTRFEKFWNSNRIAIEDPFDLGHNLGSGLSSKMNTYIIKCFRKGRDVFGNPFPRGVNLQVFLFDAKKLCDGRPPNDRGCHVCHKIGHTFKYCPQRRGQNNGSAEEDGDRKMQNTQRQKQQNNRDQQHQMSPNNNAHNIRPNFTPRTNAPIPNMQQWLWALQAQQINMLRHSSNNNKPPPGFPPRPPVTGFRPYKPSKETSNPQSANKNSSVKKDESDENKSQSPSKDVPSGDECDDNLPTNAALNYSGNPLIQMPMMFGRQPLMSTVPPVVHHPLFGYIRANPPLLPQLPFNPNAHTILPLIRPAPVPPFGPQHHVQQPSPRNIPQVVWHNRNLRQTHPSNRQPMSISNLQDFPPL